MALNEIDHVEGLTIIKDEFLAAKTYYTVRCDGCSQLLMQMGGRHDCMGKTVKKLLEKEIYCEKCKQKKQ